MENVRIARNKTSNRILDYCEEEKTVVSLVILELSRSKHVENYGNVTSNYENAQTVKNL